MLIRADRFLEMSWEYDGGRETKAEVAERIAREIEARRERGELFSQVAVESKKGMPARSFWGKAWCENLESYKDYEFRLPRGRSYLRNGNVYDLAIEEGELFAYVTGEQIYEVLVRVEPLEEKRWTGLKEELAGEIGNVVDLLGGKLGDGVMAAVTDRERGLFPPPAEIRFECTDVHVEVGIRDIDSEVGFDVSNTHFDMDVCKFSMERHVRRVAVREYATNHRTSQETKLFRTFADLALSGSPDPHWPEIALKTQRVMDACLASGRDNGMVVKF